MLKRSLLAALASAGLTGASSMVLADDRKPSGEELSRIESALRSAGFTSWEEIEFDDGHWEVDDARGSDGKKFDLRVDSTTFRILSQEEDG